MGTPTQVCVWSCPNVSTPASRTFRMSTVYVDMEIPPRMTEIRGSECLWKNGWLLFSGVQRSCIGGVGLLACVRHLCSHQDTSFKGRYDRGRRGEGPTAEDDGTAARMRVFQRRVEGPLWIDEGYGLMYLGGQQQAAPVVGTTVSAPLGLGYRALRCRELALEEGDVYSTFETDRAQSSRVPVPLLEDPYKAIRQAYLDGTDTESEPFEDPTDIETPESPLAIAPPIPLSESTPPVLVPILRRTSRVAVHVPHAMPSGLSASMAEVAAISESALRKRFRSSCQSSPSVSPPDLLLRKHYRGTSELVEDSKEDDDEVDEEIEESIDSDSVSEDAEDKGPTAEDEEPAAEDEGLTTRVESPVMDDEGYGLDDEGHGRDDESRVIDDEGHSVESDGLGLDVLGGSAAGSSGCGDDCECAFRAWGSRLAPESERPERVSAFRQPTLTTWTDPEDSIIYIDIPDYPPPSPPVQTPPSPEWTSGSLPISPSHFDVPSPVSSPIIHLTVPSPVAIPTTIEAEGFLTELGAQVEMQGGLICDHAEFGVRAREGRSDIRSDMEASGENRDFWLQLAEERRARLELTEVVDGMRRGQEPRGGA
ncbi:hypothetical protein Tco_0635663 [Tanacetum coccineum]